MNQVMGYFFAIVTSICFSLYVVPKKIMKEKTTYYTVYLTCGFCLTSTILYVIFNIFGICKEKVTMEILGVLLLRGLLWFLSLYIYARAIDKIGISMAVQYQSLKTPLGVLLTLIFLSEFLYTNVSKVIISAILIFMSALLLTIKKSPRKKIDKSGILYAIISAILLATTNLLQKWVTNQGIVYSQHLFTSLSSFICSLMYVFIRHDKLKNLLVVPKKNIMLAFLGGTAFYFASFFQALAYKRLPASVVTIIVQLSTIWSILLGVIVFKEIDVRKHWKRIGLGVFISIFAIIILI